jgi:hypothetical protein
MTVRGSDIRQMMIAGREFDVAPESNVTYRLSGFSNESNPTGNGGMHTVQRRKLGGFESLPLSVDPSRGDIEFLQDKADAGEPVAMSMTTAGATYAGSLTIQGAIDPNTGDGQVEISALGPKFEQI